MFSYHCYRVVLIDVGYIGQITGDDVATMHWPTYWKDIVVRYHVVIEGWPQDIPFRNLSDVSNLPKLDQLLRGWQTREIYFRRISDDEFNTLKAQRATTEGEGSGSQGVE